MKKKEKKNENRKNQRENRMEELKKKETLENANVLKLEKYHLVDRTHTHQTNDN